MGRPFKKINNFCSTVWHCSAHLSYTLQLCLLQLCINKLFLFSYTSPLLNCYSPQLCAQLLLHSFTVQLNLNLSSAAPYLCAQLLLHSFTIYFYLQLSCTLPLCLATVTLIYCLVTPLTQLHPTFMLSYCYTHLPFSYTTNSAAPYLCAQLLLHSFTIQLNLQLSCTLQAQHTVTLLFSNTLTPHP